MNANVRTVEKIYAAFGQGDVRSILDTLAADVAWESWKNNFAQNAGVPWMRGGRGPDAAAMFFNILAGFEVSTFKVLSLMANDRQVVAEIEIATNVPALRGRYSDEEIHLWTFDDRGKVIRFRHYVDTAKHIAAAQGRNTDK